MVRAILYSAIVGFIIGYIGMNFAKYNEKEGKFTYIALTNLHHINPQVNDLYVITDTLTNTSEFFKVVWSNSLSAPGEVINVFDIKVFVAKGRSITNEAIDADWVLNAYQNDALFVDTIDVIYPQKLKESFAQTPRKVVKVFTLNNTLDQALFRRLIKSPGGAFLIILISLLLIWFFTNTTYFLGDYARYFPKFGNLVFLVYINIFLFENPLYFYNFWFALLFSFLSLIPIYLVYQFVKKRFLASYNIWENEFFKFLLLLTGGIAFQVVAFLLVNYLTTFVQANHSSVASMDKSQLDILLLRNIAFWWLCIAIANTINNLREHFTNLQQKEKQLDFAKQKELQSQAELDALQARVNPHFLYNSLNSIAGLAQEDPAKTEEMAIALSHFFKYNTNRQTENWSTIEKEIEMLETYLAIEKIRFGDRLQFKMECTDELLSEKIPRFLLQPLVENAIKYGYQKASNSIDIQIVIAKNIGKLQFKIYDKGKPFADHMPSGYGLQSIRKKLELLYPNRHELAFVNSPKKYVVINLD